MKNNLRVVSLVMLFSIIFSGSLLLYKINNVIIPSWSARGVGICIYILTAIVLISIILKFITGIFGLTAFTKNTPEAEKHKKLKISGKLAVPVMACGILCLVIKLMYGDQFLVIDVFDIALDILLGLMFIICSLYVRSGRE